MSECLDAVQVVSERFLALIAVPCWRARTFGAGGDQPRKQAIGPPIADEGFECFPTRPIGLSKIPQTGAKNMAHYASSKGGMISLTRTLAVEFGPNGITANVIPASVHHRHDHVGALLRQLEAADVT